MDELGDEHIIVGPLDIRPQQYLVVVHQRALPLSERELRLLTALARARGQVVSRERLYELAWGRSRTAGDRSVDVYVHKLRRKLEKAVPDLRFIHTHHAIGYRLEPQPTLFEGTHASPPPTPGRFDPDDEPPLDMQSSWRTATPLPTI